MYTTLRPALLSLVVLSALPLSACGTRSLFENAMVEPATVMDTTRATEQLRSLPAPQDKIAVSVYGFDDQTGQFKANDKLTDYSSAVTKGGLAILYNALMDAGDKKWFTVLERGGIRNISQERGIIGLMNEQYKTSNGQRLYEDLPPILPAGVLIEGGIIGYDTNMITGGAGANYFGIGGDTQYRRDIVSVYLRAVSVKTGEVLLSVNTSKTIYSLAVNANVNRYLTIEHLLAAETGFTANEPGQFAVRQAIETGVYSLVMEGALNKLWGFANPQAGKQAVDAYLEQRGVQPSEKQEAKPAPAPQPAPAPVVETAPVAPVMQQEAQPLPQPMTAPVPDRTLGDTPAPQPQPMQRMPEYVPPPSAPAPQPHVLTAPSVQAPASQPTSQPAMVRPASPNALVKYLDDSRYNSRRAAPAKDCEVLPSGECKQ